MVPTGRLGRRSLHRYLGHHNKAEFVDSDDIRDDYMRDILTAREHQFMTAVLVCAAIGARNIDLFSPVFATYSQQLKTFAGTANSVLAQPLNVYPGLWLLVYRKRVLSLWITEHVVQLFVV